ncbi:MAG: hypothetical protein HZA77_04950 [Candidatus Schekmanbacteria bacterium]|nr:hypothetical protein [Candidatus Schekmanbacteria bacterium]
MKRTTLIIMVLFCVAALGTFMLAFAADESASKNAPDTSAQQAPAEGQYYYGCCGGGGYGPRGQGYGPRGGMRYFQGQPNAQSSPQSGGGWFCPGPGSWYGPNTQGK